MVSQNQSTTSEHDGAKVASPVVQAAAPQGRRLLYIDNLRILLIIGVLVQHLSVTYGALGAWDYRDPGNNLLTGIILSIPNGIGMAWGMGFFFLIAGYFTPGAYDRKGPRA